jgi:hypothetical protein
MGAAVLFSWAFYDMWLYTQALARRAMQLGLEPLPAYDRRGMAVSISPCMQHESCELATMAAAERAQ